MLIHTPTITGLANQATEATALMIDGSEEMGTRELGSLAFSSATYDDYSGWTLYTDGTTRGEISSGGSI